MPPPRSRHQTHQTADHLSPRRPLLSSGMAPLHQAGSPVIVLRSRSESTVKRQRKRRWNRILALVASATIISLTLTWHQVAVRALASVQHNGALPAEPPVHLPQPIRFISVVGLFHSGTTGMWNSIRINEKVAAEKGIDLKAYGTSDSGGYPQCGVPLLSDSSVDMNKAMGNSSDIVKSNPYLFAKYGTLWGDWTQDGPKTLKGVLEMKPPHQSEVFYTWWKHAPPQHPMLACFRPDTLYVVMVRHPKTWNDGMHRKLYDFKYEKIQKQWALIRSDPRRLPPLTLYFRSLFNAWEFYMGGYLSWELRSAGEHCYIHPDSVGKMNCLGGANNIPTSKRNVVIVRYEDYLLDPKKILAQIYSFATRGAISAKADIDKFVPYTSKGKLQEMKEKLKHLRSHDLFSLTTSDLEGATELATLCRLLGYSCDESGAMFID